VQHKLAAGSPAFANNDTPTKIHMGNDPAPVGEEIATL
jgi:hypothetical protein